MYLSAQDHEADRTARQTLHDVLRAVPCEPFDTDPEYEPPAASDDDKQGDDEASVSISADDTNDKDTKATKPTPASTDDKAPADATASDNAPPRTPSLDALFKLHATTYTDAHADVSPVYQEYARWGGSLRRAQADLREHTIAGDAAAKAKAAQRFDPFKALQQQNQEDLHQKRTRQLETEIKQLKALQHRFLEDLPTREAAVAKWETEVKAAWKAVLPQLQTHGVPMTKHVLSTMRWLHDHGIVGARYPLHVDVAHYALTRVLPYSHVALAVATLYHLYHWSQLMDLWRYVVTFGCLYRSYPRLRDWQQSEWRVRTDVLAWSAAVWTVTGDVAGAVAWWVGLELAVHYAEYVGVWG